MIDPKPALPQSRTFLSPRGFNNGSTTARETLDGIEPFDSRSERANGLLPRTQDQASVTERITQSIDHLSEEERYFITVALSNWMKLGDPDFDAALLLEQMKTNPEATKVAIESTTTRLAKEYCEVLNTAVHTTSALATTVSSSAAIVQPRIVPESKGTKVLDHSVAKVTQSATTVDPESEGTKVLDHSVAKVMLEPCTSTYGINAFNHNTALPTAERLCSPA